MCRRLQHFSRTADEDDGISAVRTTYWGHTDRVRHIWSWSFLFKAKTILSNGNCGSHIDFFSGVYIVHWLELSRLREWKPLKMVFRRFNVSLRTRLRCRWYFLSALEPKNRMALDIDAFVIVCLSWKLTAVISMITFYLMVKHLRRCSSGEIAELSSQLINQLSFNNKRLQSHRGHKSFNYKSSTKSSSNCMWMVWESLLARVGFKTKKNFFRGRSYVVTWMTK